MQHRTNEPTEDVIAAIATELRELEALLGRPLAVRPSQAAQLHALEQLGAVVDLLTGTVEWTDTATVALLDYELRDQAVQPVREVTA